MKLKTSLNLSRLTTSQRDTLSPDEGDLIYNTTDKEEQFYDGIQWVSRYADLLEKGGVSSFSNMSLFPTVGDNNIIYIDEAEDTSYRWNTVASEYTAVGSGGSSGGSSLSGEVFSVTGVSSIAKGRVDATNLTYYYTIGNVLYRYFPTKDVALSNTLSGITTFTKLFGVLVSSTECVWGVVDSSTTLAFVNVVSGSTIRTVDLSLQPSSPTSIKGITGNNTVTYVTTLGGDETKFYKILNSNGMTTEETYPVGMAAGGSGDGGGFSKVQNDLFLVSSSNYKKIATLRPSNNGWGTVTSTSQRPRVAGSSDTEISIFGRFVYVQTQGWITCEYDDGDIGSSVSFGSLTNDTPWTVARGWLIGVFGGNGSGITAVNHIDKILIPLYPVGTITSMEYIPETDHLLVLSSGVFYVLNLSGMLPEFNCIPTEYATVSDAQDANVKSEAIIDVGGVLTRVT